MIDLKDWAVIVFGFQIGLGLCAGVALGVLMTEIFDRLRKKK